MNPHDDKCACACHHDPLCMHFAPCCSVCPHCGDYIKLGYYEAHKEKCEERHPLSSHA